MLDLNTAMKIAVRETVELLQDKVGLTAAEAYSVASMGVDFRVAEAKQHPDYWANKQ